MSCEIPLTLHQRLMLSAVIIAWPFALAQGTWLDAGIFTSIVSGFIAAKLTDRRRGWVFVSLGSFALTLVLLGVHMLVELG